METEKEQDKVVSVSLFGAKQKYLNGAVKLVESVHKNLPKWRLVFFVGRSVPEDTLAILRGLGVNLVAVDEPETMAAMAWRFRTWDLGQADQIVFRDADSIISAREASAIEEWAESGKTGHIIRDHPFHFVPILGGLWGLVPSKAPWFANELKSYQFSERYGSDQDFLASRVYSRIVSDSVIHASFHRHEGLDYISPFRKGHSRLGSFCGESTSSNALSRGFARFQRLTTPARCNCTRSGRSYLLRRKNLSKHKFS
jgi:hypothetical protein